MPKVSSDPKDAFHFKGSFADGWGEVVGAKTIVFQFPPDKESGRQNPAGLFAALEIQRLVDGGGAPAPVPTDEVLLSIQSASKATGNLDLVHPGQVEKPDEEPDDSGGELGAEGNTLFAVQDGFALNDKTKWMTFTTSLVEKGFKPDVLKRTFLPDLIGLRAYFQTVTKPKFRDDQTADPTAFVVKEIKQFPYEKAAQGQAAGANAAKGRGKAKATATTASATKVAPASTPTAAPDDNGEDEATAHAQTALMSVLNGKSGTALASFSKLKTLCLLEFNKSKPAAEMRAPVQKLLTNEEWMLAQGEELGMFTVNDDGTIAVM